MALPGVKQQCPICSEEVTDAEYRRELTCSYSACPGSEHACHEDCVTKYLRKLRLPVDNLIGYQCPVTLGNGKACSGRITSTHHRQPQNQKKKQKRVEAAAAAAAAPKPKQPVLPKAKETKLGVAAATAAMRPAGEGALRQAGVSMNINIMSVASALPTIKATMKSVVPGSGPAARLNGTAAAVSNNSAMAPERVVRQRVIPGWSVPDKATKAPAVPQLDRATLAALKAEAKAGAGRNVKAPVTSTAPGGAGPLQSNRDAEGMRARQSLPLQQYNDDMEDLIEAFDTKSLPRYDRETDNYDIDTSDGFATPLAMDFRLAQEDFPAFPLPAAALLNDGISAGASAIGTRHESSSVSSGGSSVEGSYLASPASSELTAMADAVAPVSPAAPFEDDESDPTICYDQLYSTDEGLVVVQDVHGNYVDMEAVYGHSPELVALDDGTGALLYYVVVRQSMLTTAQQEVAATVVEGTAVGVVPEPVATPPVPAAPVHNFHSASEHVMPVGFGVGDAAFTSATEELSVGLQDGQVGLGQDDGAGGMAEHGAELDDLLALCMVTAPAAGLKSSLPASQASYAYGGAAPTHLFEGLSRAIGFEHPYGTGYIADAPASTADEAQAEDVDSLMQLLCV